jgi:hypothetical protein
VSLKNPQSPVNEVTPRVLIGGTAVGVAGFITKMNEAPTKDQDITVHGSSTLPVNGGIATETVRRLNTPTFNKFLKFGTIVTTASGSYDPTRQGAQGVVNTKATISGFELIKRFTAKQLQASLTLTHPGGDSQPAISWHETDISGITLDKHALRVHIDDELAKLTRQEDLFKAFGDKDFFAQYADRFFRDPRTPTLQLGSPVPRIGKAGYCMFSIVSKIECEHPEAEVQGHVVRLKGFGEIRFGEILVLPESRRLTLVQFELGCANAGRMACCDVVSQAETCPP